jgi:hypothetical protein
LAYSRVDPVAGNDEMDKGQPCRNEHHHKAECDAVAAVLGDLVSGRLASDALQFLFMPRPLPR